MKIIRENFKGFLVGVVTTALIIGAVFAAPIAENITVLRGGIRIMWFGQEFTPTNAHGDVVEPMIYNGTTYMPLRALMEAFGEIVDWDGETHTVYVGGRFITAKHILVDTYEKAQELMARLNAGENFDMLMFTYGQDPGVPFSPGGYSFIRGTMVLEFEETAFALSVGEISEIVPTAFGYHIILRVE